jgi:hypothetical protein
VVCAFAGTHATYSVADAIASLPECSMDLKGRDLEWRNAIRRAAQDVEPSGEDDEIMIIRKDELKCPYHFIHRSGRNSPIAEVREWITTGNNGFPARFLLQHFYQNRPIAELRSLALLTLYCASAESEGRIGGGFDLLLWKEGDKPDWQPIEENNPSIAAEWEDIRQFVHSRVYPSKS